MKYVEKYNCFIDDDCVIYAYGTGKKHPVGKLYQPKISLSASGYLYVPLGKKMIGVHRVIAEAFIVNDDPLHKTVIDHIDRNKRNNSLSNLRWVTPHENTVNSSRSDDCKAKYGVHSFDDPQTYCHNKYMAKQAFYIEAARDYRRKHRELK